MSDPPANHVQALSQTQERKLITYLEDQFLAITRAYKKRSAPSHSALQLPTLPTYLQATLPLLSIILQIPPIDPSTSLRTTFLLRLTGDALSCIPGYPPQAEDLEGLLEWLDDLDRAWVVVLQAQVWDPELGEGVDLVVPAEELEGSGIKSTPVNQTERTRLRSLLVTGSAALEEWLAGMEELEESAVLQQGFDELFGKTLLELGALSGVECDPDGMRGTC